MRFSDSRSSANSRSADFLGLTSPIVIHWQQITPASKSQLLECSKTAGESTIQPKQTPTIKDTELLHREDVYENLRKLPHYKNSSFRTRKYRRQIVSPSQKLGKKTAKHHSDSYPQDNKGGQSSNVNISNINSSSEQKGNFQDLPIGMKYRNFRNAPKKVDFASGDIVIEYVGELIRDKVADKREIHYRRKGYGDCYMFRIDNDLIVDATRVGSMARYLNHCCDPNCSAKINAIDGQKHILIYANRVIKAGEELTYDYQFDVEAQKIYCRCGAPNCQGRLN
eukprot:CAMPEP_0115043120 /NCGR_PEP_ID=MMETSP0216-20121206/46675_1 /TAXON_ID=223996 /ORGANISM="Protocruzia adherens, Strain Boccale" /LENGTH=280 /DNA_ID=CAMNT_0002425371 /DNA_START=693 /DNA_END=1535 /DNA_ORIENTATION=-